MEETKNETSAPAPQVSNKKLIVATVAITIAALSVLMLIFFAFDRYREGKLAADNLEQKADEPEKVISKNDPGENSGDILSEFFPTDEKSSDPGSKDKIEDPNIEVNVYEGWKIYINREIGYKLKYPKDWEVKEVSSFSELTQQNVKYINISSPGKKYSLYWGLKKDTDPFSISDRTGVGAGELLKDGKITILNTNIDINKQVFRGEIQEYFFPNPITGKTADGKYTYGASFDRTDQSIPSGANEITLAKRILESVKLIDRDGLICASTLTSDEKYIVEGSTVYHNDKYGYLMKYSSGLAAQESQNDDKVSFIEKEGFLRKIIMEWRSGAMVPADMPARLQLERTDQMKIACENGTLSHYRSGDRVILVASFEKNGTKHMLMYGFRDMGASLSSDIVEMFVATLKTIEFDA